MHTALTRAIGLVLALTASIPNGDTRCECLGIDSLGETTKLGIAHAVIYYRLIGGDCHPSDGSVANDNRYVDKLESVRLGLPICTLTCTSRAYRF